MGWLKEQREKPSTLAVHLSESTCEQLAKEHEYKAESLMVALTGITINSATDIGRMSFNQTCAIAHATMALNYRLRMAAGEAGAPGRPLPPKEPESRS